MVSVKKSWYNRAVNQIMTGNANGGINLLSSPIVLLTDFGNSDHYAGVLKGVISGINEEVHVIDLSHGVRPQDILHGAYLLYSGYRFFPRGSIFCVVVDPGVGTCRDMLGIQTQDYRFVGPDNGVLWQAANDNKIEAIFRITRKQFFNPKVSNTFHGRDIFAPVCAHLSKGVEMHQIGQLTDQIIKFEFLGTRHFESGMKWTVIHIDGYGNIVLNLDASAFKSKVGGSFKISVGGYEITRIYDTYGAAPEKEIFLIPGSSGFIEISLKNSSAAGLVKANPGDTAVLYF